MLLMMMATLLVGQLGPQITPTVYCNPSSSPGTFHAIQAGDAVRGFAVKTTETFTLSCMPNPRIGSACGFCHLVAIGTIDANGVVNPVDSVTHAYTQTCNSSRMVTETNVFPVVPGLYQYYSGVWLGSCTGAPLWEDTWEFVILPGG
jgi:hypothetical protein